MWLVTEPERERPTSIEGRVIVLRRFRARDADVTRLVRIEVVAVDRGAVREELLQAQRSFHQLLDTATVADLKRPSNGTKWNNGQLLFHMFFGYLIVLRLRVIVLFFGRLPDGVSRVFARVLEAATRPFHVMNFVASVVGPRLIGYLTLGTRFDRVINKLLRHLEHEDESDITRGMHYPPSWDPYFGEYMTLASVYRYPTRHFEHHRRQLTLGEVEASAD